MQITPDELSALLNNARKDADDSLVARSIRALDAQPRLQGGFPLDPGSGELRPGNIDPAKLAYVLNRVALGNKIDAVRIYRTITGLGLKESKDAVDEEWGK